MSQHIKSQKQEIKKENVVDKDKLYLLSLMRDYRYSHMIPILELLSALISLLNSPKKLYLYTELKQTIFFRLESLRNALA